MADINNFDSDAIANLEIPVQKDILQLQNDIRSTARNPIDLYSNPSDFKPKNDYYFGQSIASPVRPALEERNYNIEDAYQKLNDGTYIAKYDTYKAGRNNMEYFAQIQTGTEKWFNGVTKALGKTGTAVLGGTIGTVYGVGKMVEDGSLTSLYDNDFSRTLDDWNTKLDYKLPNYYTQQESEKGLFGQIGTANFWSDKVLGGLSFTAGAILSEGIWAYATGGASLGSAFARWGSESLGFTKLARGVNSYKSFLKQPLLQAYRAGQVSKNTAIALGRAGDLLNTTRFMMTSAGYEASVEALQYKKEQSELFYNNFAQLNGRQPNEQEVQEFNTNLENSANAVFGLNMAIVGSSNLVTMGKIFDLKNPIKSGALDFAEKKVFGRGIEQTVEGTFKAVEATKAQKAIGLVFDYGKAPVTEGLYEEGLQGVSSKVAGKWLQNSYDPQRTNENADMAGMVYESLAEQYGTKEGWVENGVGMIIGALGGTVNTKRGITERESIQEYKLAGLNTFQQKVIGERFLMANRMNSFTQEAEQESQKGNIVKSRIATDGVLHSRLNHAYQLGQDLNEVVEEAKIALDATTVDQFQEAGVQPQDIDAFKEQVISQYAETAQQFKKNRKYSEYIIGRSGIAGAEEVYQQGEQAMNTNNQEALIQSLTWTLTAGENAHNLMADISNQISNEVGVEQTSVLNLTSQLKRQQASKKGQITKTVNKRKALIKERDRLQKSLVEVQYSPKETEGDRGQGAELGQLNLRLLEIGEQISNLDSELQSFTDELNSQNAYSQQLGEIRLDQVENFNLISVEDLANLDSNIQKFKNLIESYKPVNPQRYQYLTDLLDEYGQAEDIFNVNQNTALAISSGQIKLSNINNWLSKQLSRGKTMDEVTKDWLIDVLNNYQINKVQNLAPTVETGETVSNQEYNDFVDNNEVTEETVAGIVNKIVNQVPLTAREQDIYNSRAQEIENRIKETPILKPEPLTQEQIKSPAEQLRDRLDNLLKNDYHSLTYLGESYDDLLLKKPTAEEIEEYRDLSSQGQEGERLEFLRNKLGNWRLLDAAVAEENQSIADIVDLINQLEAQIEEQDTKEELTNEDIAAIASPARDGVVNTVVRYDLAQNTKGSTTVQILKDKGIYKFSHLKMSAVIDNLGIPFDSPRLSISKNGKEVKTKTRASFENYTPDTVFYIDNTSIKVGAGNTLEIKVEDYETLKDALNLHIVFPVINWSYFDVYERAGEFEQKRPSDFNEDISPELIYNIKQGDNLTLTIADDEFNQQLRDKVLDNEMTPELEEEIRKSLKIYVESKGTPVSTLKGISNASAPNDNFLLLREAAKDAFISNPLNPTLNAKVKAQKVFLGSPQLITENFQPVNIPIDSQALQKVISTGYVENGELTLSRQVKDVDLTYISGFENNGSKVPVIVFKKGGYNIAYPISLQKTPAPMSDMIDAILNGTAINETEKVKQINNLIIETGIAADKRLKNFDPQRIAEIRDEFADNMRVVRMSEFASPKYRISNLVTDALINIDLNNLEKTISDPKLELDLNSIEVQTKKADKYNTQTEVEDRLSELAIELNTDYTQNAQFKYIDAKGNITEDTVYTDTFDEGTVVNNPTSHIQKIRNANALRQAFSEKLPNVVRNVLSKETINEIEFLLKKLSFLNEQTNPNPSQAEEGIQENTCT